MIKWGKNMKNRKKFCKGAYVLMVTLIIVLSTVIVAADSVNTSKLVVLLEENFEDGIMPPTDWTVDGDSWSISTDAMYGNYSAKFYDATGTKTAELFAPVLQFEDVQDVNISFWFKNPGGLDNLSVFVSWGGPWYQLGESYTGPVEDYVKVNLVNEVIFGLLMIKFTVVSGGGDGVYLDWIKVSDKASNYPPTKPIITGATHGRPGSELTYKFKSTDAEYDKISYLINWGDGTDEVDVGAFPSGQEISVNHVYSDKGTFTIRAKAVDERGAWSDESTFAVSTIKSKSMNMPFILQSLFQRFPLFERIFKLLL